MSTARERATVLADELLSQDIIGLGTQHYIHSQYVSRIAAAIREAEAPVAVWSTDKPAREGYYWLEEEGKTDPCLVFVCDDGTVFFTMAGGLCPQDCWQGGAWSPLPPPQEKL